LAKGGVDANAKSGGKRGKNTSKLRFLKKLEGGKPVHWVGNGKRRIWKKPKCQRAKNSRAKDSVIKGRGTDVLKASKSTEGEKKVVN